MLENGLVSISKQISEMPYPSCLLSNLQLFLAYDAESGGISLSMQDPDGSAMVTRQEIDDLYEHCLKFFDHRGNDIAERVNGERDRRKAEREASERAERKANTAARRNEKRNEDKPGFVYLMKSSQSGLYKIGRAWSPQQRRAELVRQTGNAIELLHSFVCANFVWAEQELHSRYEDQRQHGEWFALADADVAEIKAIQAM